MSEIPERARPHHWGFANAWLRSSFKRQPETIVSAIARAPGPDPVVEAWLNFGKTLEDEDRLDPDGFETRSYRMEGDAGEWFVAIVRMPEPLGLQEAHLLGLAVRPEDGELQPRREGESTRSETATRYFVLERADDGRTRWVEWVGDDQQPRADLSPDPDMEAFARAIRDQLD